MAQKRLNWFATVVAMFRINVFTEKIENVRQIAHKCAKVIQEVAGLFLCFHLPTHL